MNNFNPIRSFTSAGSLVRFGATCLMALVLAACASSDKGKPQDLGANPGLIAVRSEWNASVGSPGFPLELHAVGSQLYAAGADGVVAAFNADNGADVWRTKLGTQLTAGVGSDGRFVGVVSRANELIVLDSGKEIWRQKLGATTPTVPLVAGARVFVLTSDRTVSAYDAATGRKLWQQQRPGEPLVLAQSGVLIAVADTLVVGLGGRLVGLNPSNGSVRWEAAVANSRGTNEVERLVDLVGGVSRVGNQVCVRSFQSSVACVDASKGTVSWNKPASGATGIAGDDTAVFGAESDGKLLSWKRSDGERLWVTEKLRFRALSAPLLVGNTLVVGDNSGNVHFISRQDGSLQSRMTTDGYAITSAPILVGQRIVVVTKGGGIFTFRLP